MLQQFFKLVFRVAERKRVQAASQWTGLPMDGARPGPERPTAEFLAQMLRSALAQKLAESRGGRAMHQSPSASCGTGGPRQRPDDALIEEGASPPKPSTRDAEQPDGKVVRLMPRRPATEQAPSPPTYDDNDPGPSAA